MTVLAAAIRTALEVAAMAAGDEVVYRRGADSVALTMVRGASQFEQEIDEQVVDRFESWDFLLSDPAGLVLAGEETLPQDGDTIEHTVAETIFRYRVAGPLGEKPWRYTDQFKTGLRIHTKYVGEFDA